MENVTVEVFYSQTCPNCPPQKDLVNNYREKEHVNVKMTDVAKKNGRAKNYGVRAVPTTIVDGPALDQKTGFRGVMAEKKLETAIDVAKGEKDLDELENSLIDKIKGLF